MKCWYMLWFSSMLSLFSGVYAMEATEATENDFMHAYLNSYSEPEIQALLTALEGKFSTLVEPATFNEYIQSTNKISLLKKWLSFQFNDPAIQPFFVGASLIMRQMLGALFALQKKNEFAAEYE